MIRLLLSCIVISFLSFASHAQRNPETIKSKKRLPSLSERDQQPNSDLVIVSKPRAKYPQGNYCIVGTVRLKVEFLETGLIGNVFPVTRLPHGFTESAIEAARMMKFEPKRIGGKNVSTIGNVEYSFTIY